MSNREQSTAAELVLVSVDDPKAARQAVSQLKRAEANRRNARKSTGPRTPEGKSRSRMNAFKHGGTGQKIMIKPDQFVSYFEDNIEIIKDLKPVGRSEEKFAQKLADLHWRADAFAAAQMNLLHCDTLERVNEYPRNMNPHMAEIMDQSEAFRNDCEDSQCFVSLGDQDGRVMLALIRTQKLYNEMRRERLAAHGGKDIFDLDTCHSYWKLKAQLEEHLRMEAEEDARIAAEDRLEAERERAVPAKLDEVRAGEIETKAEAEANSRNELVSEISQAEENTTISELASFGQSSAKEQETTVETVPETGPSPLAPQFQNGVVSELTELIDNMTASEMASFCKQAGELAQALRNGAPKAPQAAAARKRPTATKAEKARNRVHPMPKTA